MRRSAVVLALLSLLSCRSRAPQPAELVAEGGGVTVTRKQLDEKTAPRMLSLRNQEYETQRGALEEIVFDELLKKEAAARKTTPAEVLRTDVKVDETPPDPQQIDAIYRANRAALAGRTEEEGRAQVVRAIMDRRREEARFDYEKELIRKSGVKVRLEPPRVDLKVPKDAPSMGPKNAKVTVVEFADYQCPFCQQAEAQVEGLLGKNPETVRFVLLDFPLDMKHARALPAAEAAHCAGEQGKFFEYRHSLLSNPGSLDDEDLAHRASDLRLDVPKFQACYASKRHESEIRESFDTAQALGVSATPTFFVNGRYVEGIRSQAQLQELVDDALSKD
jgi:protein-disulfide isomerase